MDACDFNGVKTENNAAIMKLHSFKCVAKFFRVVEFCFVFILLLWIFTKLPFALKISSEYFLQIVEVMLSPVFIFIICNFIIITILFNSSKLHNVAATEMYHSSFLENAEFSSDFQLKSRKSLHEDGEIVYEDKQMIFEENTVKNQALFGSEYKQMIFEENTVKNQALFGSEYKQVIFDEKALKNEVLCGKQMLFEENTVKNQGLCGSKYKEMIFEESTRKNQDFSGSAYKQMIFEETTGKNQVLCGSKYGQMIFEEKNQAKLFGFDETEIVTTNKALMKPKVVNQSEKMIKQNVEEISANYCRKVTNSGDILPETEKFQPEVTNSGEFLPETVEKVNELSNEEFQKAIEYFIAKQIKFHQQEKMAIVLHSQA